jgi:hypothetical protein
MRDENRGGARLRVLPGGGQRRPPEALSSRDAVARVLVGAAADLLLRRIEPERARSIRFQVERVIGLFDAVEQGRAPRRQLASEIDALEGLVKRREERARDRVPAPV